MTGSSSSSSSSTPSDAPPTTTTTCPTCPPQAPVPQGSIADTHKEGLEAVHQKCLVEKGDGHDTEQQQPSQGIPDDVSEAPSDMDEQVLDVEQLEKLQQQGLITIHDDGAPPPEDDDDEEGEGEEQDEEGPAEMAQCVLKAHTKPVHAVAISPSNPELVASGGEDDKVYLWKATAGQRGDAEPLVEMEGHTDTVTAVAFSMDGSLLATGGMDGRVIIWDGTDGKKLHVMEDLSDAVAYLLWHPKGKVVFAGGADSQSAMWNEKGVCLQLFAGHAAEVTCGCLVNDSKMLATGSEDCSVKVFAPKTGEVVAHFDNRVKGMHMLSGTPVRSVAAHSKNADIVLAGFDDGSVAALGIASKKVLQVLTGTHTQSVEAIVMAPSMPFMASCSCDGTLAVWNVDTFAARDSWKAEEGLTTLAWVGRSIYTGDTIGNVYKMDGGSLTADREKWTGHSDTILCLAVEKEGTYLVTGSDDCELRVFRHQAAASSSSSSSSSAQ